MKLLIAFFKDKTREISLYAGTVGIFIVVAFLYNIRMDALKYALLLVILWLLLYVITEYHRFRKKHLLLERFKKSTQECTKELPECLDYRPVERIVLTDEKWLEFVTEQILSNALKYTKNGGEIRICLEEKRGRECLVIEDNGIGIQAEDLPRVFEKGFTGYNGRADKKSTGIGLYLCKKIMDKMGHKIWIDSEVGKGTRVYLELTRKEWNPE